MTDKHLFRLTAVLEGATALGLLFAPSLLAAVLFGQPLDTPVSAIVARLAGAALLSFSVACWSVGRNPSSGIAPSGLAAVLLYDVLAAALLAYAGAALGIQGFVLWPAVVAHLVLAGWCIAELLKTGGRTPARSAQPAK